MEQLSALNTLLLQTISNYTDNTTFHNITYTLLLFVNDLLGLGLLFSIWRIMSFITYFSFTDWKNQAMQDIFDFASAHFSFVKKEIVKEELKLEKYLEESLWNDRSFVTKVLPKVGRDAETVFKDLSSRASNENEKWETGLVSGAVYSGESHLTELLNSVYAIYSHANPLHADIWPSINQCEAEVISMTANLLNGNDSNVVGSTTSGGSESIVMAVRAHLNIYGKYRGITRPEIICGDTAHPSLEKACDMFNIRLSKIECDESSNYKLDPVKVERYMTSNVIMIYASAPSFPQGVIDPIEALSDIAIKYDVGLHVDACLGGFVLPFARMLGSYDIPKFNFECPGVTSMSADTHKYGYASKGTSVVLYRNSRLRRAQYFYFSKWKGGLYVTPTIAGSRPGALLACAWASMVTIGEEGYKARVKLILDTVAKIAHAVCKIEGLYILGTNNPQAMIVCFGSKDDNVDIYSVANSMTKKGWSLNTLQKPACLHLCVTMKTTKNYERFVIDLNEAVESIRYETIKEGKKKLSGSAAIYGMAGSMPAAPVNELLKLYTDVSLKC
jgi:glutamate/tyrosine decarboxylase-like PLP-dependent enzyme